MMPVWANNTNNYVNYSMHANVISMDLSQCIFQWTVFVLWIDHC